MKPLIPFVLDGKRKVHLVDASGIYAATWTIGGNTAIVLVNASDSEQSFALPGAFQSAKLHFGSIDNMKADATALNGTIRPLGQAVLFAE